VGSSGHRVDTPCCAPEPKEKVMMFVNLNFVTPLLFIAAGCFLILAVGVVIFIHDSNQPPPE
jgi:hypothetical protein